MHSVEVVTGLGDDLSIVWMVLYNGYQHGGDIDSSGAGNLTFKTPEEADAYAKELYHPLLMNSKTVLFLTSKDYRESMMRFASNG